MIKLCEIIGRLTVAAGMIIIALSLALPSSCGDMFKAGVLAFVIGSFPAVMFAYNLIKDSGAKKPDTN
jgi:hypothetical protein